MLQQLPKLRISSWLKTLLYLLNMKTIWEKLSTILDKFVRFTGLNLTGSKIKGATNV